MTTITIDRATVEQALEALEWISDCHVGDDDDAGECASCHERSYKPHAPDCKKNNAITALRAALAQQAEPVQDQRCRAEPRSDGDFVCDCKIGDCLGRSATLAQQDEPEPVAWSFEARHIDTAWGLAVSLKHPGQEHKYLRNVKPLYTAPPQRKPLTLEEIHHATGHCGVSKYTAINIARAVEKASWEKNHE